LWKCHAFGKILSAVLLVVLPKILLDGEYMNKIILFTFTFFLPVMMLAQVSTEWISRYNSPANNSDIPLNLVTDNSGNIYTTGITMGTASGEDILTIKFTPDGKQAWTARFTGPGNNSDKVSNILLDNSGNIYIVGSSIGFENGYDYILIKYNNNGDSLWTLRFDGEDNKNDQVTTAVIDKNGFIYVSGYTINEETSYDYLTLKVSPEGKTIWANKFNGRGDNNDQATGIAADKDGNVYVTGFSIGNNTAYDFVTIKYRPNGDSVWVRSYNGTGNGNDQAFGIAVNDYGDIYVTGTSFGSNGTNDIATIKYNTSGVQQWAVRFNGTDNKNDQVLGIALDQFDNIFVTGFSAGYTSNNDFITIKYNSSGAELWNARYNGIGNSIDQPLAMMVDNMGCVYVSGYSWNGTDNDFLTVKYNALGVELWVANFNGLGNGIDQANAIGIDKEGYVYVAGNSLGSGTLFDYVLIKYKQTTPENSPNLVAPANNALGIQPNAVFDWNDLTTADAYRVQVSYDETFNNIIFDTLIYTVSQFRIAEGHLINNSKYFWRVNTNNAAGEGPWSQTWSFSVLIVPDIPTLLSPSNGSRVPSGNITLSWNALPTAEKYRLQVSGEYNFSNIIIDADGLKEPFYTITSNILPDNSVYFWRVNASNIVGTVPWSDIWTIGVGNVSPPPQPVLISLLNGSTGQSLTPVLDWNDVPSAQSYNLQISSDLNFQYLTLSAENITESRYQVPSGILSYNTLYFWKVSANNVGGSSNWSLIWTFTTMIGGLQKIGTNVPKELRLYNNDPEPFASTTQIKFDLPQSSNNKNVVLVIFDPMGKEVAKLVNENLKAGSYIINWDASNYARGYYLYQIRTEGIVETKRMLLVK
jgi:uncharacterized delta-60 repeat protein